MADFKVINTQEELDAIIKERVDRAERKIRETRDSYKDWLSPADAQKAAEEHQAQIDALNQAHSKELEKYAGYDDKFKELEDKIHGYELNALKAKIARENHFPMKRLSSSRVKMKLPSPRARRNSPSSHRYQKHHRLTVLPVTQKRRRLTECLPHSSS